MATEKTTTTTITVEIDADDIRALRGEAEAAGDMEQVALCDRALRGNTEAIEACVGAIRDAAAQSDG